MAKETENKKMNPMIILPPGTMSQADIKILRDNGICVTVAKDPTKVRFVDPIPASSSRTEIEHAAIKLSRKVLNPGTWTDRDYVKTFTSMFVEILLEGTPLDSKPSLKEQEDKVYKEARFEAVRKMAAEDAKAEKEAKKAADLKAAALKTDQTKTNK